MSKELIDQWTKVSRATVDAYKELGDISTRFYTKLFDQQLDALNLAVEAGARQLALVSAPPKSPQEFVEKQSTLFGEVNELLLAVARQTSDVLVETGNELGAWAEKGIRAAAQQVQQAQHTVRQATQSAAATARKAAA